MKVFLSAFRLFSKVQAAKPISKRWCLSSDILTGKYEKTDQVNEFYKSKLGLPIIPTSTERSTTYLPTSLTTNQQTYLPTNLPTYLPTYQPTYLPTYLPTNLPTNLAVYHTPSSDDVTYSKQ